MPTIERFGAVKICMYADDHHPPHFHVVSPNFAVLLSISSLEVIGGYARPSQYAEAKEWARAHLETLALKWIELNERG